MQKMKQDQWIETGDGLTISASLFIPQSEPKGGVIINSATAVRQDYYAKFAEFLRGNGYLVVTYDYRGIGRSSIKNSRDKRLTMSAWGEKDLSAVIHWASRHAPQLDWHCVGHSVGGQIIGFADNNHSLKSVYCVSSQSGYWNHWESLSKLRMLAMWYAVVPGLARCLGKVPGIFLGGESLPEGVARQWAYWGRDVNYIVDEGGTPIRTGFARMECNMKFLLIDDDLDFAPPKAVAALRSFYANANSQLEVVKAAQVGSKIGHFGFFRSKHEASLWPKALEWIDAHAG
ncbi:alpha/beta hydrolase superfamily protein [Vibrio sinaloensis DSM 21326]|uniref:Alpha/beta hydrolase superfamily protein n=1 Tax=Vibrio sinaloensis DSM 21326 TaxID=945550 RepID=E8MA37_PHOS4|nr:alpha/beta fold hydrolase [Vibrio sinaloensis]EGA68986.1 alpha/beta hydrolase superfamily protein [Vibrio sinaloensis DSM 21326]